MKTKTLLKVAMQSIQKNKMRATLTMLGIIIGVAAVIVMVAVGYGARSRIKDQINNLGTNMIVITPGAQNTSGVSQGAQAFANLKIDDVDKIRRESQYVSAISPVVVSRTQVLGPQGNWRTTINGVDPDFQGRSLGRKLFEAVVVHLKRQGAATVRTLVEKSDSELASFLRAVGFKDAPLAALEMRIP